MFPRLCGITHRETFLLDFSSCMWVVSTNDTFTSVPYGQPYCTRGDWEQPRHPTETAGEGKGKQVGALQLHLFGKRRRDPRSTAQVIRAKRREIEVLQQPAPDEQGSDAQLSPVGVCSCADGWSGKRTRNALGHGRIHGTRSRGPAFQQSGRKPGKPARRTTLGNLG